MQQRCFSLLVTNHNPVIYMATLSGGTGYFARIQADLIALVRGKLG
jgi:hypothetical protein